MKESFSIFLFAYIAFLLPLLLALGREIWEYERFFEEKSKIAVVQPLSGIALLRSLTIWLLFIFAMYVALSYAAGPFKLKRNLKTHAEHSDDMLRLAFFGTALVALGGVAERIDRGVVNRETGLTMIPLTAYYTAFFTVLFELIKDEGITISENMPKSKTSAVVCLITSLSLSGVIVSLFLRARSVSEEFFVTFVGLCFIGLLCHAVAFCPSKPLVKDRHYPHVHHYYWPIPFMFMCVFHTDVAMIAQAMFVAVHLHGVNCFGVEPLFYDKPAPRPIEIQKINNNKDRQEVVSR